MSSASAADSDCRRDCRWRSSNPEITPPATAMSTTNMETDPAQHVHSEAESASFADATDVALSHTLLLNSQSADKSPFDMISADPAITDSLFWHLSRTFTTRELVQLKSVSKRWATLLADKIMLIAKALWEDETKDWYYPLRFQINHHKPTANQCDSEWEYSWTWSGVHHSSGEIHHLCSVTHLPQELMLLLRHGIPQHDICPFASSGGLLLFPHEVETPELPEPVIVPKRPQRRCRNNQASKRRPESRLRNAAKLAEAQNWKPLMVINPLTKEWRMLPAADSRDVELSSWDYDGVRVHMIVDEKANTYKVMLAFRNSLCVYESSSNRWTCRAFLVRVPWGNRQYLANGFVIPNGFDPVPSAIVGGKLYFAELEVDGNHAMAYRRRYGGANDDIKMGTLGHINVFEIDEEAGTWKPPIRCALRNYFPDCTDRDYGIRIGSYAYFGIVECMGRMYAIIPARLDGAMTMENEIMRANDLDNRAPGRTYDDFGYSPLQFYILQLQPGAGLVPGQLLIQIPHTPDSEHLRRMEIIKTLTSEKLENCMINNPFQYWSQTKSLSWFRCTARGSVIWVNCLDYLLEYDVVSGQSKTRILPDTLFGAQLDLSYKPSFHMKP